MQCRHPLLKMVGSRLLHGLLGGILVVVAVGCSNGQGDGGPTSVGASLLANPSPIERDVLRDKQVSAAELEQALEVKVACYRRVPGAQQVKLISTSTGPEIEVRFVGIDDRQQAGLQSKLDTCNREVDGVLAVATLGAASSSAEVRQALQALRSCVSDAGLSAPPEASAPEVLSLVFEEVDRSRPGGPLEQCAETYGRSVKLVPPGLVEALAQWDP